MTDLNKFEDLNGLFASLWIEIKQPNKFKDLNDITVQV